MFDLSSRWPLGLNRKTWPEAVQGTVLVLLVLMFIDVWASQAALAWPQTWHEPFAFFTNYGLGDWVLWPTLVVMIVATLVAIVLRKPLYRTAAIELASVSGFIFVGVGAPGLFTNLVKRLVGRARPLEYAQSGAFHFQGIANDWQFQSFPSGHSATSMGLAFIIGFMAPRFFKLLLLLAIITGLSRVAINMHYPTDVAAGMLVGGLGAYVVRNFFASRGWLFRAESDGHVRFRGLPRLRRLSRHLRQLARR